MVIYMILKLENPTLDEVLSKVKDRNYEEIELLFYNKEDNMDEFIIIDSLINAFNYSLEQLKSIDESRTRFLAHFKRKS